MSSRYAQVDRCVWVDTKFLSLSAPPPNAQTLFLWLLTSPESGIVPGLIRIGLAGMAEAIGWPTEETSARMDELVAVGMAKVDWKARLVWLPKALSRNMPRQHQNMSPWAKAWSEIPECALKADAWQGMFDTLAGAKADLAESFAKLCPHPLVSVPRGSASESQGAKGGAKPPPMPRGDVTPEGGANPATHKHDHKQDHDHEQKQKHDQTDEPAAAPGRQCELASHTPAPVRIPSDPSAAAILDRLRSHKDLAPIATVGHAERLAGIAMSSGKPLAWILGAVDELADKATAAALVDVPWNPEFMGGKAAAFAKSARKPRDEPVGDMSPEQVATEQRRRKVQVGATDWSQQADVSFETEVV